MASRSGLSSTLWRGEFSGSPIRLFGLPSRTQPMLVRLGGRLGCAEVIDARYGSTVRTIDVGAVGGPSGVPCEVYPSDDGAVLTVALDSGRVRRWAVPSGHVTGRDIDVAKPGFFRFRQALGYSPATVSALAVVPGQGTGGGLYIADTRGAVRRVDTVSGAGTGHVLKHSREVSAMAGFVSRGGPILACGDWSGALWRWNPVTGDVLGVRERAHLEVVKKIIIVDDGVRQWLVTAGSDLTVRRWDALTGDPIGEPIVLDDTPMGMAVVDTDHGGVIVVACDEHVARYDLATGDPVGTPVDLHEGAQDLCVLEIDGETTIFAAGDEAIVRHTASSGRTG